MKTSVRRKLEPQHPEPQEPKSQLAPLESLEDIAWELWLLIELLAPVRRRLPNTASQKLVDYVKDRLIARQETAPRAGLLRRRRLLHCNLRCAGGEISAPSRSRSETQAYVERCIATPADVERTYMLVGREDDVIRGAFALRRRAPHRLDCGYVLAHRWWRQGLMTEALIEVTAWALRQSSVFRIGAVCDVDNIGSVRVLEKSGFVREGLLRRWLLHPNISAEPRDCYSYARVR